MKEQKLYHTDWFSLNQIEHAPGKNYIYFHCEKYNGKVVAILPFRINSKKQLEYLVIDELRPCWGVENLITCSITGGVNLDQSTEESAIHEILEETGYLVEEHHLIDLGTCKECKASDSVYNLFAVDLTNKEAGEIKTDGTGLEKLSKIKWIQQKELSSCDDPLLGIMFLRLMYRQF